MGGGLFTFHTSVQLDIDRKGERERMSCSTGSRVRTVTYSKGYHSFVSDSDLACSFSTHEQSFDIFLMKV